jgi:hypothetical protein
VSSIPPNGPPKVTVTTEYGDVRVTIRGDLTPTEALSLVMELTLAAREAAAHRFDSIAIISEAARSLAIHDSDGDMRIQ